MENIGDDSEIILDYKPNIFDIHRYYESYLERGKYKPIVGNFETRTTLSLLFPLRGVSIVVKGPAGSGKSTIIKCASQLIWGDGVFENKIKEVLYLAGSSDKGLLTDTLASRIAHQCTHCVVPELQNAINNERVEAIIKLWTEGEAYNYTRSTNSGTIGREIILRPLPIMTSIATENKYTQFLGEEMERRFFPFFTIAKGDLNKQIHQTKADSWAKVDEDLIKMSDDEKMSLRLHIRQARESPCKVKNPSALFMKDVIPHNFVVSNSMIEYWFELVAAITKFFYTDRMVYKSPKGEKRYVLSTPTDNWLAWKIGGEAIVLASQNVPDMGREIINMLPIRDSRDFDSYVTINELVDELQKIGIERTKKQIQQIMKALESVNYAKRDDISHEKFYRTQEYKFETIVDWKGCVDSTIETIKELYPEISKDYIDSFCMDPPIKDPFTNQSSALLDIPFEKKPEKTKKQKIELENYL